MVTVQMRAGRGRGQCARRTLIRCPPPPEPQIAEVAFTGDTTAAFLDALTEDKEGNNKEGSDAATDAAATATDASASLPAIAAAATDAAGPSSSSDQPAGPSDEISGGGSSRTGKGGAQGVTAAGVAGVGVGPQPSPLSASALLDDVLRAKVGRGGTGEGEGWGCLRHQCCSAMCCMRK